jgi:hypothetical protein
VQGRTFAELLIDCKEDRPLRAVLVGMLRDASVSRGTSTIGGSSNRPVAPCLLDD